MISGEEAPSLWREILSGFTVTVKTLNSLKLECLHEPEHAATKNINHDATLGLWD
jgi:hypothetical protein